MTTVSSVYKERCAREGVLAAYTGGGRTGRWSLFFSFSGDETVTPRLCVLQDLWVNTTVFGSREHQGNISEQQPPLLLVRTRRRCSVQHSLDPS